MINRLFISYITAFLCNKNGKMNELQSLKIGEIRKGNQKN